MFNFVGNFRWYKINFEDAIFMAQLFQSFDIHVISLLFYIR